MGAGVRLVLPLAPSGNIQRWQYRCGSRKDFQRDVQRIVRESGITEPLLGRLAVTVIVHPTGLRRPADLDNAVKRPLDALARAGVYRDDGQIDDLRIRRGVVVPGGALVVTVREREGPRHGQRAKAAAPSNGRPGAAGARR